MAAAPSLGCARGSIWLAETAASAMLSASAPASISAAQSGERKLKLPSESIAPGPD
jgi:hypothetical protein